MLASKTSGSHASRRDAKREPQAFVMDLDLSVVPAVLRHRRDGIAFFADYSGSGLGAFHSKLSRDRCAVVFG